jgi:hypothetical protein
MSATYNPEDPHSPGIHEKVFDLTDNRDLTEIEYLCNKPEKIKFHADETITLPFRHIRYEVLKEPQK